MLSRIGNKTAVALGISESGKTLQQRLSGQQSERLPGRARSDDPHGLPWRRCGEHGRPPRSRLRGRHRHRRARRGSSAGLHPGCRPSPATASDRSRSTAASARPGIALGATRLTEEETILGGRLASAYSSGGSTSWFADGAASFDLGKGWGAYAAYRRGWTSMPGTALAQNGRLSTDAWAVDVSKNDAFRAGDSIALAGDAAASGPAPAASTSTCRSATIIPMAASAMPSASSTWRRRAARSTSRPPTARGLWGGREPLGQRLLAQRSRPYRGGAERSRRGDPVQPRILFRRPKRANGWMVGPAGFLPAPCRNLRHALAVKLQAHSYE